MRRQGDVVKDRRTFIGRVTVCRVARFPPRTGTEFPQPLAGVSGDQIALGLARCEHAFQAVVFRKIVVATTVHSAYLVIV